MPPNQRIHGIRLRQHSCSICFGDVNVCPPRQQFQSGLHEEFFNVHTVVTSPGKHFAHRVVLDTIAHVECVQRIFIPVAAIQPRNTVDLLDLPTDPEHKIRVLPKVWEAIEQATEETGQFILRHAIYELRNGEFVLLFATYRGVEVNQLFVVQQNEGCPDGMTKTILTPVR